MSVTQTYIMYLAVIFSSTACIWLSEKIPSAETSIKIFNKRYKFSTIRSFFIVVSLLVLIVPLVQRSCGADTPVYYFDYSTDRAHSFDAVFDYLLVFIHSYISEPKIGLGIISTVTIVITVLALLSLRSSMDITLAFFAYVTCVYFYSYNYMRMMFALSFVFIGYSLCILEKRKMAIIPFVFASLFHLSTIIVLVIHIAIINFRKHRRIVITLGVIGLIVFLMMPYRILSLISIERYSSQIIKTSTSPKVGIGTTVRALPILYLFYKYHKKFRNDNRYTWLLVFAFANIIFSFLGYYVGVASRISNVLLTFHIIYAVPMFIKEENNVIRIKNTKLIFIAYCIFMYYVMSRNFVTMQIVPYF